MLIVKHNDTDHPHLHIVYNRVNNQGKTISDSFQRELNVKIIKAITLKYGFHISEGKGQVNRQQLKGKDKIKYLLFDCIKAASRKANSMDDLKTILEKQGIAMIYKYRSGNSEIQGISFSKDGIKFKGSEIDRSLSYGNLSQTMALRVAKEHPTQDLASQLRGVIRHTEIRDPISGGNENINGNSLLSVLLEQPGVGQQTMDDALRYRKKKKKGQSQSQSISVSR